MHTEFNRTISDPNTGEVLESLENCGLLIEDALKAAAALVGWIECVNLSGNRIRITSYCIPDRYGELGPGEVFTLDNKLYIKLTNRRAFDITTTQEVAIGDCRIVNDTPR